MKVDYFVIVYEVLNYFYDCLKNDVAEDEQVFAHEYFRVNKKYWRFIVDNLIEKGYLQGVEWHDTRDGGCYSLISNVSITHKVLCICSLNRC